MPALSSSAMGSGSCSLAVFLTHARTPVPSTRDGFTVRSELFSPPAALLFVGSDGWPLGPGSTACCLRRPPRTAHAALCPGGARGRLHTPEAGRPGSRWVRVCASIASASRGWPRACLQWWPPLSCFTEETSLGAVAGAPPPQHGGEGGPRPLGASVAAGGRAFLSLVLFVFLLSMRRHSLYDHVVESAYALKSWENETFSIEPLDL